MHITSQVATMKLVSVVEDVDIEQFVEEEISFIDGRLPRVEDYELYDK